MQRSLLLAALIIFVGSLLALGGFYLWQNIQKVVVVSEVSGFSARPGRGSEDFYQRLTGLLLDREISVMDGNQAVKGIFRQLKVIFTDQRQPLLKLSFDRSFADEFTAMDIVPHGSTLEIYLYINQNKDKNITVEGLSSVAAWLLESVYRLAEFNSASGRPVDITSGINISTVVDISNLQIEWRQRLEREGTEILPVVIEKK
jgi:hypothetical protein